MAFPQPVDNDAKGARAAGLLFRKQAATIWCFDENKIGNELANAQNPKAQGIKFKVRQNKKEKAQDDQVRKNASAQDE